MINELESICSSSVQEDERETIERLEELKSVDSAYYRWLLEGMDKQYHVRFYLDAKRRLTKEQTDAAAIANEARRSERLKSIKDTRDDELYKKVVEHFGTDELRKSVNDAKDEADEEMEDFERELREMREERKAKALKEELKHKRQLQAIEMSDDDDDESDSSMNTKGMERTLFEMEQRSPNVQSGDPRDERGFVIVGASKTRRGEENPVAESWKDGDASAAMVQKTIIIRRNSVEDVLPMDVTVDTTTAVDKSVNDEPNATQNKVSIENDEDDDAQSCVSLTSGKLHYYGSYVSINYNVSQGDGLPIDCVSVVEPYGNMALIMGKLYEPTTAGATLRAGRNKSRYVLAIVDDNRETKFVRLAMRKRFQTQKTNRYVSPFFEVGPVEKLNTAVDYCAKLYGKYTIEYHGELEHLVKEAVKNKGSMIEQQQ